MSVTKEVRDFISNSLAENNRALLTQISKLVSDSAENLKRANAEATDEQLRQVKKLRREEPESFKRKGNEIQYKFNSKLQDSLEEAKTHLETNAVEKAKESLTEGTLLLTNSQHELAEDEDDGKKIRRAEERAEKALKSASTRKTAKQVSSVFRPSSSRFAPPSQRASSGLSSWRLVQDSENHEVESPGTGGSYDSVIPQVSVKGKLSKSIAFWHSIGVPDFILSVIRDGYKIPFISTPPPHH
ncbi:hypothetical protein pdam_00025657, partial [Pocillopora damicornis]